MELIIQKIQKDFDQQRALFGISCTVQAGVTALLGPNGAGKSTLLRILSTQLLPSFGHFTLDGKHSMRDVESLRREVGMIGHKSFLYRSLSVEENLLFYARLYQLPQPRERLRELAAQFHIDNRLGSPLRELSRGLLQRVALVRALLHEPKLLLLDEPFTGLDTPSANSLMELLRSWRGAPRLVLLTTHDLARAFHCCERFVLLRRGRVVQHLEQVESLEELQTHYHALEAKTPTR